MHTSHDSRETSPPNPLEIETLCSYPGQQRPCTAGPTDLRAICKATEIIDNFGVLTGIVIDTAQLADGDGEAPFPR